MAKIAWKPNFPALEDILGSTPAKVFVDILCDYAYKSLSEWRDFNANSDFNIDEEHYVKRSSSAILMYVSVNKTNLSRSITKLKDFGILGVKKTTSKTHPNGINKYKPFMRSAKYIELAQKALETEKDEFVIMRIQAFIDVASEHDLIFDTLGINHQFVVNKKAPL